MRPAPATGNGRVVVNAHETKLTLITDNNF